MNRLHLCANVLALMARGEPKYFCGGCDEPHATWEFWELVGSGPVQGPAKREDDES